MAKLRWTLTMFCLVGCSAFADAPVVTGHLATSETQIPVMGRPQMDGSSQVQTYVSASNGTSNYPPVVNATSTSDINSQGQDGAPTSLSQQLQMMQDQMRHMQGQIEVQAHELQALQQQSQASSSMPNMPPPIQNIPKPVTPVPTNVKPVTNTSGQPTTSASVQPTTSTNAQPTANPPAQAINSNVTSSQMPKPKDPADIGNKILAEQQAYDEAYRLLLAKQYENAEQGMKTYLQQYPQGTYAGNAHYWLGELYLTSANNTAALTEFQTVALHFGATPKAPDAMLKIAFLYYNEHQYAKSARELQDLIAAYPNTPTAALAQKHLNDMKKQGKV